MIEFIKRFLSRSAGQPAPTGRSLAGVIDQILKQIPQAEENARLRRGLDDVKGRLFFTSPEAMLDRWQQVTDLLNREIGDPRGVEWKERVVRIINDE